MKGLGHYIQRNSPLTRWGLVALSIALSLGIHPAVAGAQWAPSNNDISNTNTGNVGIGTTTPAAKLDVNGALQTNSSFITNTATDAGGGSGVYFRVAGNERWNIVRLANTNDLQFSNSNIQGNILMLPYGNVGIGTTTPTSNIDVTASKILDISSSAITALALHAGATTQEMAIATAGAGTYFDIAGNATATNNFLAFRTSNTNSSYALSESMRITSAGFVGIGTTTPAAKLHVAGDVLADGNLAAKYQDVAEWVPARRALPAGTVVVLDVRHANQVVPSAQAYDTKVAGVVSATPGLLLGEAGAGKVKVATTGRVTVKADAGRGAIAVGDLLVTSDIEGVAMRSEPLDLGGVPIHRPGTVLGKALEPLREGEGKILVLLTLQ